MMVNENQNQLLTIQQAAEKMKVSRQTIYAWIKSGRVKPWKTPSGRQRIVADSLIISEVEKNPEQRVLGSEKCVVEDISDYEPIRWEPTGLKEKFWFEDKEKRWPSNDNLWLFKVGRETTGENWAEVVSSGLCELLGLPHAEYRLARYKGKEGVITPNFAVRRTSLVLGNELLMKIYPDYTRERSYLKRKHTLRRVLGAIGKETRLPINWEIDDGIIDAIGVFAGYLMLDAWIGNTDRHEENWGFLRDEDHYYLAPTFDHASSFGSHETDERKAQRLETKDYYQGVESFVKRARSAIFLEQTDNKPMSTLDAFKEIAERRPDAGKIWIRRMETIGTEEIESIIGKVPSNAMSDISKKFTLAIIEENKNRLKSIDI